MQTATALLLALALGAAPAAAQQAPPVPDPDGVYRTGPGIESPYLTSLAVAALPADTLPAHRARIVRFSAVIAADGSLTRLKVIDPLGDIYETAATRAVRQSTFASGTLNGAAVPVLVCLRVRFIHVLPAIPRLTPCPQPGDEGPAFRLPPGVTPPRATYVAVPQYSEEARRKRIEGVVLLSTLVTEQGSPTDVRVEKGVGYGLDENAARAVSQYRFQPATDPDGKPVAVRVHVEVSFQLN